MFVKKHKNTFIALLILFGVFCIFFYKVIIFHDVPFPGDLLVSTSPFKTESYLGYRPGGYPNKGQGRDVITQLLPWNTLETQEISNGIIPFWNPYNFSGNILMQNYQSGAFYPIDIILFFSNFIDSWTVFILLQPLLAMIFMYVFLREMKLGNFASLIASVAFGFSSFMIVWLEWGNIDHTFLWLPIILFFVSKLFKNPEIKWGILLMIALTCCMLAGHIQSAFYIMLLSFVYGVNLYLSSRVRNFKILVVLAIEFISSGLISSINILPTLSFFQNSTRGVYSLSQIQNLLNQWYYLATLFAPDFFGNPATRNFYLHITYFERTMYVGVPILFFAFYSLRWFKDNNIKFFAFAGLISLILSLNLPGVSFFYLLPLPVITTTVPTRILSIFIFSAITISAFGIDKWIKEKRTSYVAPVIFLIFYIVLWATVILLPKHFSQLRPDLIISEHNLILPTLLFLITLVAYFFKQKFFKLSIIVLFLIVILDSFYLFQKFTPFSPKSLVYPQTPVISFLQKYGGIYRSWGYGNAYIPANYHTFFHIFSADGYDSLFIKDYAELLNSSAKGAIQYPLSRTDANIAPGYGPKDLRSNPYRQTILNLTGVKYVINLDENLSGNFNPEYNVFPGSTYKLIWQNESWQIYENKNVLPRFFLTPQIKIDKNPKKALSDIYKLNLSKILILDQSPEKVIDSSAKGIVKLVDYQPNSVKFTTFTTGREFLFLSDSFYPDWKVSVDNVSTPLYKADYSFRAVEVPKGKHSIIFYYFPNTFRLGLILAIFGIIFSCLFPIALL